MSELASSAADEHHEEEASKKCPLRERRVQTQLLCEAFRRAYLSGRLNPKLSDYPPCLSEEEVGEVYTPHVLQLQEAKKQVVCVSTQLAVSQKVSGRKRKRCNYAGDDVVLALLLTHL